MSTTAERMASDAAGAARAQLAATACVTLVNQSPDVVAQLATTEEFLKLSAKRDNRKGRLGDDARQHRSGAGRCGLAAWRS